MSDDLSPVLSLPLIQSAQAQKHVTHNEALRILDILVQPAVASRSQTAPPAEPEEGARHIVPAGATGAWAGRAGALAHYGQGAWEFLWPLPGWQAHVADEGAVAVFAEGAWRTQAELPLAVARLGVATAADDTNRLAVAAPATLLTHAGAGHQLKLNKAAAGDTASLLFQTGWSGRAEMGTAGSDGFAIKVSPDGAAWTTALQIAPGAGRLGVGAGADLPAGSAAAPALAFAASPGTGVYRPAADQLGLAAGGAARAVLSAAAMQVDVPLTGSAVTAGATDAAAGRVARFHGQAGILGWGAVRAPGLAPADDLDALFEAPAGFWRWDAAPANAPAAHAGVLNLPGYDRARAQLALARAGTVPQMWLRSNGEAETLAPTAWARLYHERNILGTVSQSGGLPTGAVIERGANANGDYVRFADGTQICSQALVLGSVTAAGTGTRDDPYRTGSDTTWTYPAAFAAPPRLSPHGYVDTTNIVGRFVLVGTGVPTTTNVPGVRGIRMTSFATAGTCNVHLTAIGRWY